MKRKITYENFIKRRFLFVALFLVATVLQFSIRAGEPHYITFTYDFQAEIARTEFTVPPAYYITIGKGNTATAGVVSYTDSKGNTGNMLTPYGVGQRNATGVVNLNAFPKKATDYSVTWKQCNDDANGDYKTGVVLRADTSKIGTSTTGYVQGFMEGYVLLPYKTARNGSEFRIYKSTADQNLSMLVNTPVPTLSPAAKQPVWYRASVSGDAEVVLLLEYSIDSVEWNVGATYTDMEATFKSGATQLLWGLAISRTDFYFDNITFHGLAEDEIDTPDNPDEPKIVDEELNFGGEGKHIRLKTPVTTNGTTITREMIVYLPNDLPENMPLLISCHGSGQGADYQATEAKYYMVSDTAKFVTVYPAGINKQWNTSGDIDLNFMSAIIELMYERYKIDKERVYLSGFSMGSMFTYYAANKMADKIAAFAPTMGWNRSIKTATSCRPVPIIQIIGTDDTVFTPELYNTEFWVIFNAFIARNACATPGIKTQPYPIGSVTSQAIKTSWMNEDGIEVVLITTPKGHWHSNDPLHIMSNLEIWNFCKHYSINGLISPNTSIVNIEREVADVVSKEYFDIMGNKIVCQDAKKLKGIYIVRNHMSDGTVDTQKMKF